MCERREIARKSKKKITRDKRKAREERKDSERERTRNRVKPRDAVKTTSIFHGGEVARNTTRLPTPAAGVKVSTYANGIMSPHLKCRQTYSECDRWVLTLTQGNGCCLALGTFECTRAFCGQLSSFGEARAESQA